MMGKQEQQKDLFSYQIDLDKRIRADNPLRQVAAAIDFSFVRAEVKSAYGHNGNVSIDPVVILKLMFLLFFDNVRSERQLMEILPERLDYLWFLGYGLNDAIPHHSVLSKARTRWGSALFEKLFVQTAAACVRAGLVDGRKIYVDGSLIAAHASKDSIVEGPPELLAALRQAYQEQASKLDEPEPLQKPEPAARLSTTDPDAELVRRRGHSARLSYKQHRVVDDAQGIITAQCTTGGLVGEDDQLMGLIEAHEQNTALAVETVVADSQYGTAENFLACADRGVTAHMADWKAHHQGGTVEDHFRPDQFIYNSADDTYRCPAGKTLRRYQKKAHKPAWEYKAPKAVCAQCALRARCTNSKAGRRIQRYERQTLLDRLRMQTNSWAARRDRHRRQHLSEKSFADATNCHGFKRSRWRRLWRQQIQNHLIAACQNVRTLIRKIGRRPTACLNLLEAADPISSLSAVRATNFANSNCRWN
jgi:transposase